MNNKSELNFDKKYNLLLLNIKYIFINLIIYKYNY